MNSPNINTEPSAFQHTRQAREAEQTLDQITDRFDDNPKAMDYFYGLFRRIYCRGEALQREGTLVGTTCIHAPEELIYAVGAQPLRLCNGSYHFDQAGGDFMPAKSCSLVKATLGVLSTENAIPGGGRPELVVNPTTCDQKKKASAMVEEMGYNVYDLELPPGKESEEARLYWQRSVRDFSVRLSKLTGKKLTRSRLKAAMAKTARAQLAFRTLHNLRKNSPALFLGKDAFLVTNAYFFDDIDRWTEAVEQLNEELRAREASGYQAAQRKAPRILFTGSPPIFPNLKLPLLIEEAGGVVVADETCSANRMLYDMSAVDEWRLHDMVDALADRHLKTCTCPIFTNNLDRRRRLLELAESFNADGVVYQAFAGCQVYEMEQRSVAKTLSDKSIPMLYVETDYSPDDMGQLSTRIEAFLESIKTRKRKRS
ncbi:MAG: double-cubane-cluster-containing anaerobic reductase [Candidatus Thiodiazotropha sp.]